MGTTTLKASTLSTVMLFTGVLAIGAPGPIAETSGKRFECNPSNPILPAALVRARLANFRRLTRSGELSVTFIFLASVLISLLLILQGSWLIYGIVLVLVLGLWISRTSMSMSTLSMKRGFCSRLI